MHKMGIWEMLGGFVGIGALAWYVCMGGFKRKCNTPEKDKGEASSHSGSQGR